MRITIEITETEQALLEDSIADVQAWAVAAVRGKIKNCEKRFLQAWQKILIEDPAVEEIPATVEGIVDLVLERSDYLTKAERDALEAAELIKA